MIAGIFIYACLALFVLPGIVGALRAVVAKDAPHRFQRERRALRTTLTAVLLVGTLPFVAPFTGNVTAGLVELAWIVATFFSAFLIARQLSPGWSIFGVGDHIIACILVAGILSYALHSWGWQGMSLDDLNGLDQGGGFEIAIFIMLGTLLAPFIAVLLTFFTHRTSTNARAF